MTRHPICLLFSFAAAAVACQSSPEEFAVARLASEPGDTYQYDPTSIYDQKGLTKPRGFSIQSPHEAIDPFSGNLVLRHVDLQLPGAGGHDLVIERVYNSKIHRNYAARITGDPTRVSAGMRFQGPTPIGLGWTMHWGRLYNGGTALPNDWLQSPRYFERSDGSQEVFYEVHGTPDSVICTSPVCLVSKRLDSLGFDQNGTPQVSTADGKLYIFGHNVSDGYSLVSYATEIWDSRGNVINIYYHDDTIPGIAGSNAAFVHFPERIVDSLGRVIEFGYQEVQSGTVRLTSVTAAGRTYQYGYVASSPHAPAETFLAFAQPPTGAPWRYAYAGLSNGNCANQSRRWCELTSITTLNGGTISFNYIDTVWYAGSRPMSARAVSSRTAGGAGATSGTWTYTYQRGLNYLGAEHTRIRRPDNSTEIHTYYGIGSGPYFTDAAAWQAGLPAQSRILSTAGAVLETVTYNWARSEPLSDEVIGDPWIGFEVGVALPQLSEKTVVRHGTTYRVQNTSFSHFNVPRCTVETGDAGIRYSFNEHTSFNATGALANLYFWALPRSTLVSGQSFGAICDEVLPFTPRPDDKNVVREYNSHGEVTRVWDNGKVTDYRFHQNGDLEAEIVYRGSFNGQPADGYCTAYPRYRFGVPERVEYGAPAPNCSVPLVWEDREINSDGSVAVQIDGRGNRTTFAYDGVGRVIGIQAPELDPITVTYDGSNQAAASIRRVEQGIFWTQQRFDGLGREYETTTSAGVRLNRRYDGMGRLAYRSYPHNGVNTGDTYTYDGLSRLATVTHADGRRKTYSHSGPPYVVTVTDEENRQTVLRQKAYGSPDETLLAWVRLPGRPQPAEDQYTWTVDGRLLRINYEGLDQSLVYDPAKLVAVEDTGADRRYFGHDLAGNLRCRGDSASCSSAGWQSADIRYGLDGLGRTEAVQYAGSVTPPATYTYRSGDGLLERIIDGGGEHQFFYYPGGRLQRRISEVEGVSFETAYEYDRRGNVTAVTYPSGRRVTYQYDSGNRLTSIPGFVAPINYHPSGLASSMNYQNGRAMTLTLDARRRPDRLTVAGVMNHDYNFSYSGNLTGVADGLNGASSITLGYDELDRLRSASGAWGLLAYEYDASGNRTRETRNGAAVDLQFLSNGAVPLDDPTRLIYNQDSRGNATIRANGVENYRFDYDLEDRLIRVWRLLPNLTTQLEAEYVYDGQGRRVRETSGNGCGSTKLLHYSTDGLLLAETSTFGITTKEYIVGSGRTFAEIELTPIEAQPSQLNFGEVEVGATASAVVELVNHTEFVVPLAVEGSASLNFGISGPLPAELMPSQTILIPVEYVPIAAGEHAGTFAFCAGGVRVEIAVAGSSRSPRPIVPLTFVHGAPLDPSSVTPGSLHVYGAVSGYVAGSVSVNGSQVTFTPSKYMSAGEEVTFAANSWVHADGTASPPFVRRSRMPVAAGSMVFTYSSVAPPLSGVNYRTAGAGDMDADGYVDLVLELHDYSVAPEEYALAVWRNDRRGGFAAGPVMSLPGHRDLVLADVNGDSAMDVLLWQRSVSAEIQILFGGPSNLLSGPLISQPDMGTLEAIEAADLDADGDQDLIIGGASTARVLINDGLGNYSVAGSYTLSAGVAALEAADLDQDGDLDIFALGYGPYSLSTRLYNNGNAQFPALDGESFGGQELAIADLSADGLVDAFVLGTRDSSVKLGVMQNGAVRFASSSGWPLFSASGPIFLTDFNADGDLDAVAQELTSARLFVNDGTGNLALSFSLTGLPVGLADFGGDGSTDIALLSSAGGLRIGSNQ